MPKLTTGMGAYLSLRPPVLSYLAYNTNRDGTLGGSLVESDSMMDHLERRTLCMCVLEMLYSVI